MMMKNKIKKYKLNMGVITLLVIGTILAICVYAYLTYQIHIEPDISKEKYAILETAKSVLIVMISVLGLNLLLSSIIDVVSKNNTVTDIMVNDVVGDPVFYNSMDLDKKKMMYDSLEASLFFQDKISQTMHRYVRERLLGDLDSYYYSESSYSITCSVHDEYIEKEVTRTTKIRSYNNACSIKDYKLGSFSAKKINGLIPYEVNEVMINEQLISNDKLKLVNSNNRKRLDDQNDYDYTIDYIYKDTLKLYSDKDTIITMKYITRTSKDDRVSTFRVGCPCKKFSVYFTLNQSDYRIMVNAYGFMDDANKSNNNQSKTNINISFSDWIFKHDGVTVVILEK